MLSDLRVELGRIRNDVVDVIRAANPTLEIRAAMIMATIWLGVIEARVQKTLDPAQRREVINEFWQGRNAIEKTIRGYRRGLRDGDLHPQQEPRRAMP